MMKMINRKEIIRYILFFKFFRFVKYKSTMPSSTFVYKNKKGEEVRYQYEYESKRVPYMKLFEVETEKILPLDKIIAYLEKKGLSEIQTRIQFLDYYRKLNREEKANVTREIGVELPKVSRRLQTSVRTK